VSIIFNIHNRQHMETTMYRKETRIIVTLISTILIFGFYVLYVYFKHVRGNPGILDDFRFWGRTFLIFIPVAVAAEIILHIIFAIINKIVTNQDIPTITDEMDKLIELKALRISHWTFTAGFVSAMGFLAFGSKPYVMFIVVIIFGLLASIAEGITKIYYYRKGI
jgi:hypothetical protein